MSMPRRRLAVAAGLVLVLAVGIWVFAFSSVFGVRNVTVSGTALVSPSRIEAAAGIRRGTPLSRLDTGAIRARVAAIPELRSVTVATSFPSSVTIRVTERVAVGYRADAAGAVLVDAGDDAFRTVTSPPAGLPRLEVSGDRDRSAAVAEVAASFGPVLAHRVALVSAPTTESITLRLSDQRTVLWGGTDRSADKARLVIALLGQPGRYFDVSDPSSVISRGA